MHNAAHSAESGVILSDQQPSVVCVTIFSKGEAITVELSDTKPLSLPRHLSVKDTHFIPGVQSAERLRLKAT